MKNKSNRLKEELGRNQFTKEKDPYQYYQTTDELEVEIYPIESGYEAKVIVHSDSDLSSPIRRFTTETEAQHFARQYSEFVIGVLNQRDNK